jgi:hypothetical protein
MVLVARGATAPEVATPTRRAGSVRRTTSLDVLWPDGADGAARFEGVGRDLLTHTDGSAEVLSTAAVSVDVDPATRQIVRLSWAREKVVPNLVGAKVGRGVRQVMAEHMSHEVEQGSLTVQLLDDLTGGSIVAGFALSLWGSGSEGLTIGPAPRRQMEGVCLGFAPGSSALASDGGIGSRYGSTAVEAFVNPADPVGWHDLPQRSEMSMRRARRIDVRRRDGDEGALVIDSMFQDSATTPSGGRRGVHQYGVRADADPRSLRVLSVEADPRLLPYSECPMASLGLVSLVGVTLPELREFVPVNLKGVHGCTHLNDAMRALSCVGALASHTVSSRPPQPSKTEPSSDDT